MSIGSGLARRTFSKPRVLAGSSAQYIVAELDFDGTAALNAGLKWPEMIVVAKDADALPAEPAMFTGEIISG